MFTGTRTKLILSFLGISLLAGALSLAAGWRSVKTAVLREAEQKAAANLLAAESLYINERDRLKELVHYCCEIAGTIAFDGAGDQDDSEETETSRGCPLEVLLRGLKIMAETGRTDFTGFAFSPGSRDADSAVFTHTEDGGPVTVWGHRLEDSPERAWIHRSLERWARHSARIEGETTGLLPPMEDVEPEAGKHTGALAVAAVIPKNTPDGGIIYTFAGELIEEGGWFSKTVESALFPRIPGLPDITGDIRIVPGYAGMDDRGGQGGMSITVEIGEDTVTAFKPLTDIFGNPSARLVSSVDRNWFDGIITRTVRMLLIISVGSMLIAAAIGSLIAHAIYRPVYNLIEASREVSRGNLNPEIEPISKDELGVLQRTFLEMTRSLRRRDEQIHRASETKLLQSEKQASIGRLAAGVAHEINNPLTGVLTFTHLLLKRKDLDEEMREDLTTIASSTERVREIVKGLLDFSRQTEMRPQLVDINELIKHTITLVGNQALVKGVVLCFHPQENLPKRTVDRNQMESVLINILINAIDSTPKGGHIVVTTSTGLPGEIKPYPKKGIEISIADTGSGIPPEHLNKLFDPFFTTKEVGKGTGLGLAVSYGIIEKHGGTIRVKSKVGEGSTFIIWLPLED